MATWVAKRYGLALSNEEVSEVDELTVGAEVEGVEAPDSVVASIPLEPDGITQYSPGGPIGSFCAPGVCRLVRKSVFCTDQDFCKSQVICPRTLKADKRNR